MNKSRYDVGLLSSCCVLADEIPRRYDGLRRYDGSWWHLVIPLRVSG
ncbi:hypothetical protein NMD99_03350 [Wolbachia endosymbiont of Listronotus oregonensis]|nr:hypothetical protein [Wolbachia endosymbiont of Listronotus oregonensis]WMT85018.1 hypothetical protein NMD99_03350 [Wolbachia endosymbiont of Listronotus oregonensis]